MTLRQEREASPLARILTSDDAEAVLAAALESAGVRLQSWSVHSLHARPGAETSVTYRVDTDQGVAMLVATTADFSDVEREVAGAVKAESAAGVLTVWAHPGDPVLTDLPRALHPQTLTELVGQAPASVDLLVYRPLRRAVVRVATTQDAAERVAFLKVVRPKDASRMLAAHEALDMAAPRARALTNGIVAVDPAPGRPLLAWLRQGERAPRVQELEALLDSMQPARSALEPSRSWVDRLATYVEHGGRTHPEPERFTVAAALSEALLKPPNDGDVVHGDFHPGNVFWDGDGSLSVIDVDRAGLGRRVDDWACMAAHLAVLPCYAAGDTPASNALLADVLAVEGPRSDLAARAAAVVLTMASTAGTPKLARDLLAVAEGLLDRVAS